jgi:hypothetical protein
MARPRKGTEEVWFDTFSEWPEDDRAAALKVLTHLHRALNRQRGGRPEQQEPEQIELREPEQPAAATMGRS